eukprot:scaffold186160_cov31-Prasinocladus_malaysianus.AAC.1
MREWHFGDAKPARNQEGRTLQIPQLMHARFLISIFARINTLLRAELELLIALYHERPSCGLECAGMDGAHSHYETEVLYIHDNNGKTIISPAPEYCSRKVVYGGTTVWNALLSILLITYR